jgi:putative acetyltransferase
VKIRPYRSEDRDAVVAIYQAAVHELAADHYDAAQREAWAPSCPDLEAWGRRLADTQTLVAEGEGELMGFIAYEPTGYVDLLFSSPRHARKGVATALYQQVEQVLRRSGVTQLVTEASLVARPFFERQGFRVTGEQRVKRGGQLLRRYSMRKG